MPLLGLIFAKFGLNLSATALKVMALALVVLVIVGVIFAGYVHFEHERTELIAQTRAAAQAEIEQKFAEKSEEIVRRAQAAQAQAMSDMSKKIHENNATIDQLQAQIEAIPDETSEPEVIVAAPQLPPSPKPATPYGELRHVPTPVARHHTFARSLPDLDPLNAALNRMLERASGSKP